MGRKEEGEERMTQKAERWKSAEGEEKEDLKRRHIAMTRKR